MSVSHSDLNVKVPVGAFNLVGAFLVIEKTDCETDGSFYSTSPGRGSGPRCPGSSSSA